MDNVHKRSFSGFFTSSLEPFEFQNWLYSHETLQIPVNWIPRYQTSCSLSCKWVVGEVASSLSRFHSMRIRSKGLCKEENACATCAADYWRIEIQI
jgi:hypothetical protein